MPAPTLNEILLILSGHGITMPQVESAMGDWIDRRIDNRMEEKEKGEVMDMEGLVKYLEPFKKCRSTIYKWSMNAKYNKFPCHRIGRRLHFYKSEIDSWLRTFKG